MTYNESGEAMYVDHFTVENGRLNAYYKGDTGPQGIQGETGPQGVKGDTGPRGAKGDPGISPTFTIENGHLFADYDNPYSPT